jgi:ABC-2 type transport system ATP-binding protein
MDEAERCHEIAYIAYGKLLAEGTVDEVIAGTGLVTFTVSGPGADRLQAELEHAPGVDMIAPFGTSLHVAGRDAAALEQAIAPYRDRPGLKWEKGEPTLEDAFIDLMRRSEDNFK